MYAAIVCHITLRPHPNADRLQLGLVAGHQIVTGPDTIDGQLGAFFPSDGQLSHEFCYNNNEYRQYKGENKDPGKFGYFEENRRVRTIKLRGEKSEGYWVPISNLAWTGVDLNTLKPGMTFTELNGQLVCDKYYSPATKKAMAKAQKQGKARKKIEMFKEHYDTEQLRYCIGTIPHGARIIVTEKCHGTSGRTGHVLVPQTLSWFHSMWNQYMGWTGLKASTDQWEHVTGTRRVVLDNGKEGDQGFYAGTNFREEIHKSISLFKGETIYYEIVGYEGTPEYGDPRPIMGRHSVGTVKDSDPVRKDLAKKYGESMVYSYGTEPGMYKVLVYRITRTTVDGESIDLDWTSVKARCRDLGLETVPELQIIPEGNVFNHDQLMNLCESLTHGCSTLDRRHIREGVCVRIEHPDRLFKVYKYKSFAFCHLEGIAKNSDDYVDMEEVS